ncbi:MAG: D-alanyl-D-alanine carboxypeptidase/D-alanyl-D-alanine-endopeptidase [Rhodospirillales bacterium CG15_BIG_FIL_POST_REV_8_21_14_020_66_15]|nr:MAG: D-alanyl-D-alanine carboxypeptidase/D-alanyl-D-alanine-endopeptidase [Rhodospirillales bacterium CG15_BIG_FIL_POST_REV_8_21_14_020_66_15]
MDGSRQVKAFQSLGVFGRTVALAAVLLLAGCAGQHKPEADPVAALGPTAEISYTVVDADTGGVLAARAADRPMPPASTAKVATMVAALELLGPDFRFQTRVLATAAPDPAGTLAGDLVLAGGGDPLLAPQDLYGLAVRLRDLGLTRVAGRFIYDETLLPAVPAINPDQPAEARYNPGVSALSVDFNRWRLIWRPEPDGGASAPALTRLPPLEALRAAPAATSQGPGREILWRNGAWRLGADAAPQGDRFLPVRNPGLATAQLFRRLAAQAGVTLPPPEAGAAPEATRLVAAVSGQPLAEVARLGLEHSNNLVSELTGLTAARLHRGRPETLAASTAMLSGWLQRAVAVKVKEVDWRGWRLPNHSGLSRHARVTANQMAAVLRFAHGRRYGGWPFASLLPTAGFRKAFRDRFLDEAASGRIWAKTGTLHYAKGLAGYLSGPDGRTRAFALYIADPAARRAYDGLPDVARDDPAEQERALAWIDAAERAEQAIVLDWLARF